MNAPDIVAELDSAAPSLPAHKLVALIRRAAREILRLRGRIEELR